MSSNILTCFTCRGYYYALQVPGGGLVRCRSRLDITLSGEATGGAALITCYMNPGAGKPATAIDDEDLPRVTAPSTIPDTAFALRTVPDATQVQTIAMMKLLGVGRAHVLNLSDLCEPSSPALPGRLSKLRSNPDFGTDSIFHPDRFNELASSIKPNDWVIAGWGALPSTHKCLRSAAELALKKLERLSGRPVAGKRSASGDPLAMCHPRITINGKAHRHYYTAWRKAVAKDLGLNANDIELAEKQLKVDRVSSQAQLWVKNGDEFAVDLTHSE